MKKIFILFILNAFMLYANGLENLTLTQALDIAKKNNLELSIAKLDEKIKALDVEIVKTKNFGSLNLTQNIFRSNDAGNVFGYALSNRKASFRNFGFSDFLTNQQNPNLLDIKPDDLNFPSARNFFQTKIQYKLPLYTGGKIKSYQSLKKSLLKISSLDKEAIKKEKIYQVKKTYADIKLLDSFIKNLKTILKTMDKLSLLTQNMFKAGYAKKVDILEIDAKKSNITRMLNHSFENKKLALQFLTFLLNQEIKSIDTSSFTPPQKITINKKMVENIIEYKKAKEGLKISNDLLNVQKANFLPSAGFVAEYGSSSDKFLKDFARNDFYTIGVQVQLKLFNGGADAKSYEQAKVAKLKSQNQLQLATKGLWLKISKLNTQIQNINFDIQSVKSELNLAKVIYENYIGRYKESLVSINDVLIKQSNQIKLTLKLKELQNKKYDAIFALNKIIQGE